MSAAVCHPRTIQPSSSPSPSLSLPEAFGLASPSSRSRFLFLPLPASVGAFAASGALIGLHNPVVNTRSGSRGGVGPTGGFWSCSRRSRLTKMGLCSTKPVCSPVTVLVCVGGLQEPTQNLRTCHRVKRPKHPLPLPRPSAPQTSRLPPPPPPLALPLPRTWLDSSARRRGWMRQRLVC